MESTRGKPLFNCLRAHVHVSTRCLRSNKAPFQQQLLNDGAVALRLGHSDSESLRLPTLFCVSDDQAHQTLSNYLAPLISASTVTKGAT